MNKKTMTTKAIELKNTVKVGDEFTSGKDLMKVTEVTETTVTLGMNEVYKWEEFRRYITIGAIKPKTI